MSIDPFTGRNPSYCFVDLDRSEDAEAVKRRLGGYKIRGRPIKIDYDVGKRSIGPQRTESHTRKGEWRRFDSERTTGSPMVFDRYARKDARDHWTKPVEEGRRLYVGGLSDNANQGQVNEEMRHLFSGFNIQAVSKRVLPRYSTSVNTALEGRCYCFVDLPSSQEAEDAIVALDGRPTCYGGAYKIKIAHSQQDRKVCREQAGILTSRVGGEDSRRTDTERNWRSRGWKGQC